MCVSCLRAQVDITEGIPKALVIHQCRGCARFLRPPWVACDLESKELLAICLKKINGLSKVKLVDAGFIWTEPHSRHIKVKLTIQKDVLNGVKLQQIFAVDFSVQNQQCDACQRSYTDHHWRAQVQVRQKVKHKKTFYLLEQLILKHGAHEKCSGVEQVPAGVDFNFLERSHALKFIDFLGSVVPTRSKAAKQLVSEDIHTANKNFKFTYAVEIVPLCRDDLAVVPSRTAAAMGNIDPVSIVFRMASVAYFVDPRSLQVGECNADKYWREPFRPICTSAQLQEFTVLDVTPVTIAPITGTALRRKQGKRGARATASEAGSAAVSATRGLAGRKRTAADAEDGHSVVGASSLGGGQSTFAGGFTGGVSLAGGSVHFNGASSVASTVTGGPRGKLLLADAEIVRSRDLGVSDERFVVRTHLGNILRPGDAVLGYDLSNAVYNEADAESNSTGGKNRTKGTGGRGGNVALPDIVLVRKVHRKGGARESSGEGGAVPQDDAMGGSAAAAPAPRRPKERVWKLKRLDDVLPVKHSDVVRRGDEERAAAEYESFLQELEADPSLRKGVNLYKNAAALEARAAARAAADAAKREQRDRVTAQLDGGAGGQAEEEEEEEEEGGNIGLEELLEEMELGGGEEGGAGGGGEAGEGAWGGTPTGVEPGFEPAGGSAGHSEEAVYDDGGFGLTVKGRQLTDVAEEEEEDI